MGGAKGKLSGPDIGQGVAIAAIVHYFNEKKGDKDMDKDKKSKEAQGSFTYQQDSKRFHRYQLEAEGGIVGTVYIPKKAKGIPDRITLEKIRALPPANDGAGV